MIIIDPTSRIVEEEMSTLTSGDLHGKTVGILTNHWLSMDEMSKEIEKRLTADHGVKKVNFYEIPAASAAPNEVIEKAVLECDAAIVGLAN
jgi:predicted GTPase